ncbi:MAG TPA: hypothetical protein VJI12_02855 [archaeon]|nr:hypothetical protein [archaeon]
MKRHARYVSAERQLLGEVTWYIKGRPELEPYRKQFIDEVTDRLNAVFYRVSVACESLGVESRSDTMYKMIEERVESRLPTWEQIAYNLIRSKGQWHSED